MVRREPVERRALVEAARLPEADLRPDFAVADILRLEPADFAPAVIFFAAERTLFAAFATMPAAVPLVERFEVDCCALMLLFLFFEELVFEEVDAADADFLAVVFFEDAFCGAAFVAEAERAAGFRAVSVRFGGV